MQHSRRHLDVIMTVSDLLIDLHFILCILESAVETRNIGQPWCQKTFNRLAEGSWQKLRPLPSNSFVPNPHEHTAKDHWMWQYYRLNRSTTPTRAKKFNANLLVPGSFEHQRPDGVQEDAEEEVRLHYNLVGIKTISLKTILFILVVWLAKKL